MAFTFKFVPNASYYTTITKVQPKHCDIVTSDTILKHLQYIM